MINLWITGEVGAFSGQDFSEHDVFLAQLSQLSKLMQQTNITDKQASRLASFCTEARLIHFILGNFKLYTWTNVLTWTVFQSDAER